MQVEAQDRRALSIMLASNKQRRLRCVDDCMFPDSRFELVAGSHCMDAAQVYVIQQMRRIFTCADMTDPRQWTTGAKDAIVTGRIHKEQIPGRGLRWHI